MLSKKSGCDWFQIHTKLYHFQTGSTMSSCPTPAVHHYKYKLITPSSDSLHCPVCLDVADDPWQHDMCGKVFCRKCIEQYGKKKPCAHCRGEQPLYFEDTKSESESIFNPID